MSYALFTHHTENYNKLSRLTWEENKVLYAKRHGYAYYAKTENWKSQSANGLMTGFEKLHMAKDILESHPEHEWIWWTGTDSMITNMHIRIEDKIDNDYHFMMSVDFNGLNADSLLIRNSAEGRQFIDEVLTLETTYVNVWDSEQRAIAILLGVPTSDHFWNPSSSLRLNENYSSVAKIVPQKYMNSYNFELYHPYYPHSRNNKDKLDYIGNWTKGDWLIHWPATNLDMRVQLANHYNQEIVF